MSKKDFSLYRLIARERGIKLYQPFYLENANKRDMKYFYRFTPKGIEKINIKAYAKPDRRKLFTNVYWWNEVKNNYALLNNILLGNYRIRKTRRVRVSDYMIDWSRVPNYPIRHTKGVVVE